MKILLVEDQDLERRRTKELLETNGFVLDQARSAEEALSYARVYEYDAGIVDLHLTSPPTRMEGLELIRNVRRLRRQGGFVLHGFVNPPNEITAGLDILPAL